MVDLTAMPTIINIAITMVTTVAAAGPLPHPKTGQCSGGYMQSGAYCVPKSERSPPAIRKVGSCPAGWSSGASTCERMR
jgi:hypothetical protein